jgi:hypothetical protein
MSSVGYFASGVRNSAKPCGPTSMCASQCASEPAMWTRGRLTIVFGMMLTVPGRTCVARRDVTFNPFHEPGGTSLRTSWHAGPDRRETASPFRCGLLQSSRNERTPRQSLRPSRASLSRSARISCGALWDQSVAGLPRAMSQIAHRASRSAALSHAMCGACRSKPVVRPSNRVRAVCRVRRTDIAERAVWRTFLTRFVDRCSGLLARLRMRTSSTPAAASRVHN